MSCILQYLSACVVGATLENRDEEEEGDENDSDVEFPWASEEIYEIVGTLSKPDSTNPLFAKETYAVSMSLISDCLCQLRYRRSCKMTCTNEMVFCSC